MNDKKENLFEEKQERREFFKTLGKTTLPAIAFFGLGTFGDSLRGSQKMNETQGDKSTGCKWLCSGSCEGGCKGSCDGGCQGSCEGDCKGSCEGDCSGTCEGDSEKSCTGTWKACSDQ